MMRDAKLTFLMDDQTEILGSVTWVTWVTWIPWSFGIVEAMAKRYLGDTLDIHGGGLGNQEDLTDFFHVFFPLRHWCHLWRLKARSGFPAS